MPDISVVIPAFNCADLLAEALKSVREQSLPPREVIVVDDGSADNTAEVAERMGARVFQQQNNGVSAARNAGVRMACGEWIAFLDADDLWEPDKLRLQWEAIQQRPSAGMVCSDFSQFDGDETALPSFLALPNRYERATKLRVSEQVSFFTTVQDDFFEAGNFLFPSAVMVRRDAIIKAGLFDETMRHAEDRECFLRVLSKWPLLVVEKPLMRYRLHSGNASNDDLKMALGALMMAEKICANSQRYPIGATEHAQELIRRYSFMAGRLLVEAGRHREARPHLLTALRSGLECRKICFLLASLFPPSWVIAGKKLKRRQS